ncbi:MAG TPA: hypothetical protein PKC18_07885 [Lacipirellulaceae bacterium]|nr:hypothetical protein [Lacipirellulaceae bacterium]
MAASLRVLAGRFLAPAPAPQDDRQPAQAVAPARPPVIATSVNSLHAKWRDPVHQTAPGTPFVQGTLGLVEGVVELQFDGGARLIIEAPAEVALMKSNAAQLHRGRVVAIVPPEAIGFALHARAASFVDLGTEFGVSVSDAGEAQIHVLDGEVALVRSANDSPGPSQTLRGGAASLVSADGARVEKIRFDQSLFLRRVPSSAYELAVRRSRPLAYWRLQDPADATDVVCSGRHGVEGRAEAGVVLGRSPQAPGLAGAAEFSLGHEGIALGVLEAVDAGEFTCEAWVLPAANLSGPKRILSNFARPPRTGFAFGLVDGPWYQFGDELLVHFTAHGVYDCISEEAQKFGQWAHVAATVDAQGEPQLYVNGRPAGRRFRPNGEEQWHAGARWNAAMRIAASANALRMGRNPPRDDAEVPIEPLLGQLSEVAIYDRALDAEEIRRHYDAARTPTTDDLPQRDAN